MQKSLVLEGYVGGWVMYEWMDGRASLRIAYSNQKTLLGEETMIVEIGDILHQPQNML